jgi:hypothetical protein
MVFRGVRYFIVTEILTFTTPTASAAINQSDAFNLRD